MTNVIRFDSDRPLPASAQLREPKHVERMLEILDDVRAQVERGELAAFVMAAISHGEETYVFRSGDGTVGSLSLFGALNYVTQRFWDED